MKYGVFVERSGHKVNAIRLSMSNLIDTVIWLNTIKPYHCVYGKESNTLSINTPNGWAAASIDRHDYIFQDCETGNLFVCPELQFDREFQRV